MNPTASRFVVHLLEEDEQPDPEEFVIGTQHSLSVQSDDNDATVLYSVPLIVSVLKAAKEGRIPSSLAIYDIDAETTSAWVVAMGTEIPLRLCLATTLYDRVSPEAVKDIFHRDIVDAYYGFLESLYFETDGDEIKMLQGIPAFWQHFIWDEKLIQIFFGLYRDFRLTEQFGISNIVPLGNCCIVTATGWAHPLGLRLADTVILMRTDDLAIAEISIATIADDETFMAQIHDDLCQADKNKLSENDAARDKHNWVLQGGNYLTEPPSGTRLSEDEIIEIVTRYAPERIL